MKRGSSGLSLVLGIDKPLGISSHDVVNRCRRIFNEKRIGHAGTLDPLASGVLLLCVGPATRLNSYLSEQDKRYRFSIAFGRATDTGDKAGQVIKTGPIPATVYDRTFAENFVQKLVGQHQQTPPAYSAIKVQGRRSYQAARLGLELELKARSIEIYEAKLLDVGQLPEEGLAFWDLEVTVSKGSYIRSLACDIGVALKCPAHVNSLRRLGVGALSLNECVSLEKLEEIKESAALDPVPLLGYRIIFLGEEELVGVANGTALDVQARKLFKSSQTSLGTDVDFYTSTMIESTEPLKSQELLALVAKNKLLGLYRYQSEAQKLLAQCVFPEGVIRGDNFQS